MRSSWTQPWLALGASSLLALSLLITPGFAPAAEAAADAPLERSYRRLLPLEGGSNFRDLGGYPTAQGSIVKRGVLFRSGAMTGLTAADQAYLGRFGFQSIVFGRAKSANCTRTPGRRRATFPTCSTITRFSP